MEGDTLGVRVIPPVVQFIDTEVTVVQRLSVTVKNVSRSSRDIRFYSPQDKVTYVTRRGFITHLESQSFQTGDLL